MVGDNDARATSPVSFSNTAVVMEHTHNNATKDDIDRHQQDPDHLQHVNVSQIILDYQMRLRQLSEITSSPHK